MFPSIPGLFPAEVFPKVYNNCILNSCDIINYLWKDYKLRN